MDAFVEAMGSWNNFYFMEGGAAAGMLGLMFVAMSLGVNLVAQTTQESVKTFVRPTIFYFAYAILIACVMLVPMFTAQGLALSLFVGGSIGLAMLLPQVVRLVLAAIKYQDFLLSDWLGQIIAPVMAFILLLAAALFFVVNNWSIAFAGLWVATVLLLICGIANTWGLVVWIIEQHQKQRNS